MLKLENIKKDYYVGDFTVHALRGVSLEFRKNEFVAILGPSGCGKTTMLNIVGGLDRYTSGDLMIKGRSTKGFKDRDWDTYRNHSVGFVFQSYNLIPHQTVLGNVELALTIAGMSKTERQERAKAALDKVGLSDQYKKRPNQLSGGQMQRVAIARALVNDPEIVLADEPTGALDTVTSKQIMDLLREIAKERLVIMVTHNSEIADQYSTRIIRLKDGEITEDTNPFKGTTAPQSAKKSKKQVAAETTAEQEAETKRRAKMSLLTAFRLSLQNLISKKRRSMMVSVAGSIGIIGVSLVLAFSFGIQGYITNMQRDMLSGNPIMIQQTAFDINAMMRSNSALDDIQLVTQDGFANIEAMLERIKERATTVDDVMVENTIVEDYLRFLNDMPAEYLATLHYDYGLDVATNIFTTYTDLDFADVDRELSLSTIRAIFGSLLGEFEGLESYASMISMVASTFAQLPANNGNVTTTNNYISSQYNLVPGGKIASSKNEINIVLGQDSLISDILLTQLGYYSQQEFMNIVHRLTDQPGKVDPTIPDRGDKIRFTELSDKTFTWYSNDVIFSRNTTMRLTPPLSRYLDATPPYAFDYHSRADNNVRFQELVEDKDFVELTIVGILQPKTNMNFGMLHSGFYYTTELAEFIIETNKTSDIVNVAKNWEDDQSLPSWWPTLPFEMPILPLYYFTWDYTYNKITRPTVESDRGVEVLLGPATGLMGMLRSFMGSAPMSMQLGGAVFDGSEKPVPHLIQIYPASLEIKPKVLSYLRKWNLEEDIELSDGYIIKYILKAESAPGADDAVVREQILHSDPLSLIFRLISQLVELVTIALVSFTSLALVVSCVMIGIITYVSVVERVKEIGVIRSLGGRKRDVANLFTAETFILGFAAGVIGVAFTYLLSWSVSALVWHLSGIANIAFLPFPVAVIMITLSVLLTLISGLLPSRSAARKDPVVALRTE